MLVLTQSQARSLEDIDVEPLPRKPWDGWKKGTPYAPEFGQRVEWKKPEGKDEEKTEDDLVTYYGNCHCGKIRYALRSKNLDDMEVMQCNCSMCGKVSTYFLHFLLLYLRRQYHTSMGEGLELDLQFPEQPPPHLPDTHRAPSSRPRRCWLKVQLSLKGLRANILQQLWHVCLCRY
jgi:hypothetical protein